MPIWEPALTAAGLTPADVTTGLHYILPPPLDANFLLHLGPFADVIPIPLPIIQNVASIGDVFLTLGLAFFLFAAVVRSPAGARRSRPGDHPRAPGRGGCADPPAAGGRPGSGDRPVAGPDRRRRVRAPARDGQRRAGDGVAVARDVRRRRSGSAGPGDVGDGDRGHDRRSDHGSDHDRRPDRSQRGDTDRGAVRQHPYVRLALNPSFSALWAGQLISLFGDRLNQLALVAVVAISTGSALATGLVFFAATLPNLLLSPIAGTFVDRWDHKEVMVVSDILRAAIVLILPVAAITNIVLVYPLIFLVTSISVFFRPARVAILPAHRPRGGPAQRELGAVGRRDDRRRHRLPAGGAVRRAPRQRRPARLLGRQRDLPGLGRPDRLDGRPQAGPLRVRCEHTATRLPGRARCRLAVPPARDRPAGEHAPGHGRAVQPGSVDRAHPELRPDRVRRLRVRAGRPRTASSRPGSASATSSAGSWSG